ncbi:exodeoxyribonuclease III [Legionella sp. W05-934-2]|jgi:exodeoxyribonuclease-3|uniref:exodeoxyribonuclease III n=1 Tax=Legionella sp. W05-934-2 TaxID=1198649 RepID=UPI0034632C9E
MLNLASWNVNSLKVRLPHVLDWLADKQTDILALQETKLIDENFPHAVIEEKGYYVCFSGQKTYNGVAILSRFPMHDVETDVPGLIDPQRRILAATINNIRVINLYVPNGASLDSDKYSYKLDWLKHVSQYVHDQLEKYDYLAVVGDFNIAPSDLDVHDPKEWVECVLVSQKEREAFANLLNMGLVDSFRHQNPDSPTYSWWDYRAASFRRNRGLRIDHILTSPLLTEKLKETGIDKEPRKWEQPSDHAPVWASFNFP